MASQEYQAAFERYMREQGMDYSTSKGTYDVNTRNINTLMGVGADAQNSINQAGSNMASNISNNTMSTARSQANALTGSVGSAANMTYQGARDSGASLLSGAGAAGNFLAGGASNAGNAYMAAGNAAAAGVTNTATAINSGIGNYLLAQQAAETPTTKYRQSPSGMDIMDEF